MKEVILCEEIKLWRDERGIYQVVGESRERGVFVLLLSGSQAKPVSELELEPHLKFSLGPYKAQPALFT